MKFKYINRLNHNMMCKTLLPSASNLCSRFQRSFGWGYIMLKPVVITLQTSRKTASSSRLPLGLNWWYLSNTLQITLLKDNIITWFISANKECCWWCNNIIIYKNLIDITFIPGSVNVFIHPAIISVHIVHSEYNLNKRKYHTWNSL